MSLATWLKQRKAATMAVDFTTEDIGGGPSENAVTGNTLNEVFFRMSAAPVDGDPRIQYAKHFVLNDHADEDLHDAKIFLANGLANWGASNYTVGVQSSSVEDTGLKVRCIGRDVNGDPFLLEVNVTGTTLAASSDQLSALHSAETRDQATGVLQAGDGGIRIYRGGSDLLGEVPPNFYGASSEFDIWLPAALDDAGTSLDAATAPSGSSFSRPRTVATSLNVSNGGVLTAGAAQGVWTRWTLQPGTKPRYDLPVVLGVYGADFAG